MFRDSYNKLARKEHNNLQHDVMTSGTTHFHELAHYSPSFLLLEVKLGHNFMASSALVHASSQKRIPEEVIKMSVMTLRRPNTDHHHHHHQHHHHLHHHHQPQHHRIMVVLSCNPSP